MEDQRSGPPWHVAHVIGHMRTGGAERQLANYLLAADRAEFRHTLLCLEQPGEMATSVAASGIPVTRFHFQTRYAPLSVMRFAAWLRRERVSVIHTHMHHAAFWGRLGGIAAGTPVMVTTEHGRELWKNRLQVEIDHQLSRHTARHIAVSQENLEQRIARERVEPAKLIVIPNGVPMADLAAAPAARQRIRAEFGIADGTPVFGSVGRFIEAKGYVHMLDALAVLRCEMPDVVWLSVGDGELSGPMADRARELGLADNVRWAGRRSDINDLLAAMDIWAMSSIREGLPVALLEAMSAGKAIVATAVGGIPDAARRDMEALLVPPADAPALADAMATLLKDRARAGALGEQARRRAEDCYSIESIARRIEGIYRAELAAALGGR